MEALLCLHKTRALSTQHGIIYLDSLWGLTLSYGVAGRCRIGGISKARCDELVRLCQLFPRALGKVVGTWRFHRYISGACHGRRHWPRTDEQARALVAHTTLLTTRKFESYTNLGPSIPHPSPPYLPAQGSHACLGAS